MSLEHDDASSSAVNVDISDFLADLRGVHYIKSCVPAVCLEEETIMGIDEAGRGPVLGPMVYGTTYYPVLRKHEFEGKKFADSKILGLSQREKLFSSIVDSNSWIGWKVAIISPDYISNCMLQRTKYSLNEVSHDAAIDLIRKVISDGIKLTEVYVDTVGDPRKYESKLEQIFPQLKITVAKKADSIYPVVSAASICAKVVRDICIKKWMCVEQSTNDADNQNIFGSGYPSDPTTKQWLKDNCDPVFGYSSVVRFGWSTCKEKLDSKAYEVRWPDCEDMAQTFGNAKINQFFSSSQEMEKPLRHRYFEEKGFKNIPLF